MKKVIVVFVALLLFLMAGCIGNEKIEEPEPNTQKITDYHIENLKSITMPAGNQNNLVLEYYHGSHIKIGGKAPDKGHELEITNIYIQDGNLNIQGQLSLNKSIPGSEIDSFELITGDLILNKNISQELKRINLEISGVRGNKNSTTLNLDNSNKKIKTTSLKNMSRITSRVKKEIETKHNDILVVVELKDGSSLPDNLPYKNRNSYENLREIEASSNIIRALSQHRNVTNIRKPMIPSPDE